MKSCSRTHNRFQVSWHVRYGTDDFTAEGVVADVSPMGCRIRGALPVGLVMPLALRLYPSGRDGELPVQEGHVVWVKSGEFGLELKRLSAADRQWLIQYAERAERRSTFHHVPVAGAYDAELSLIPLVFAVKE